MNTPSPTHTHAYRTGVTVAELPGRLGIPALRPHQRQAIEAAGSGRDVLLNVPTAGGKSYAFWGAGSLRGGLTLVISPLRSLMADQARRLAALGLPVAIWNSDQKPRDKDELLERLQDGWSGFLYLAPEGLKSEIILDRLIDRVNLAVIDEAHCTITEQGFRGSYRRLGSLLDTIRPQVRFACTATLPAADLDRLTHSLGLVDPVPIIAPVARSNIEIKITERSPWVLAEILRRHQGESGIIFTATVRAAEKIHGELAGQGWPVTIYTGRLTPKVKKANQAAFMSGEKPIAVVTDAFLLGVDKADLRFVAHYDHPATVEAWVQGFGRAGRDGLPATAYGCFLGSDEGERSRRFLIRTTYPSVDDLRAVWDYLISGSWHQETQDGIAVKVLGRDAKYKAGAIIRVLRQHRLIWERDDPNDRRRLLYRGAGNFERIDWTPYTNERREAFRRFDDLRELVVQPETEIPELIDQYFGAAIAHDAVAPAAAEKEIAADEFDKYTA